MLPELRKLSQNEPIALKKEFSSKDTALNLAETVTLLEKHKIMISDVDLSQGEELLR
jgi:hypothetical protein